MNSVTSLATHRSALATALSLPVDFPLALNPGQQLELQEKLAHADLAQTSLLDIARQGSQAEENLHQTLGHFLSRVEQGEQPRIFKLVERLREGVDREELPALADRILNAKPTLGEKVLGFFSKKRLSKAMARAYEELRRIASGKTRNLSDLIKTMEQELREEQARLEREIHQQEALKQKYQEHFVEFALAVAFMSSWVAQASASVRQATEAGADPTTLRQLNEKLQALQSRALALESTLTRLPSDQLTIRMLENAGISTLQETMTTAASRFSSIKMTLLTIHGALVTQGVQRLAEQGAELDRNLDAVRAKLVKDVVTSAANAPGDNRLRQAEQLRAIAVETRELVAIVDAAAAANQQKFESARQTMAQTRQALLELGVTIRPDLPLPN